MKKTILLFLLLFVVTSIAPLGAQETGQTAPKVIQAPFGQRVVEEAGQEGAAADLAAGTVLAQPEVRSEGSAVTALEPGGTVGAQEPVPISLFLDNADIHQIIQIIGETLGINYIVDPAVQGTVNINTAGNLLRSDLLPILETILRINGATIIQAGNFYEIVPANAASRQALPVQDGAQPLNVNDQFVIQVVRMKFVSAGEMSQLLTPYLSEGANIVVHESGNILLISERRGNLRKLLEIVDVFDTNVFEGERVRLFPVENNLAADLVQDLVTIFAGYALSDRGEIRFVAIERMNSVLVVSPNVAVFNEAEKWLDRLDQPLRTAGVRNFVYRVRNAKASDIHYVLSRLYATEVQLSSIYQTPTGAVGAMRPPAGQTPVQTGADAQVGTAFVPSGNVKIIADEVNNALVIQATPQDYAMIKDTIEQLDVLPRQVLIDTQIYEVVLDDSIALGLSAMLQNRGTLGTTQTTASFAGSPPALAVRTFAFIGRARELFMFLNASENRSRVRTLSAPSVLVSDNKTAYFTVGAEVPVPVASSASGVQGPGGGTLFAQTIQRRETGVIMNVTPHINDGGNVTLEISQEVSQAGVVGPLGPIIGQSAVSSTVVVRDGQTIVLGGFIRESTDLVRNRIPLLGRIPGLGILFGSTSKSKTRTELVVLITPHVIRSFEEADQATEELRDKLREIKKMP